MPSSDVKPIDRYKEIRFITNKILNYFYLFIIVKCVVKYIKFMVKS